MLPFMTEGFEAGDKLINILAKEDRPERLEKLRSAGIDTDVAERTGQLELRPWEEAHLREGRFDLNAMLTLHERHFAVDTEQDRTTRMWSNQEWALNSVPDPLDLLEYESRFNYIWPRYKNVYVCVYDANKFGAAIMMQMLRSHPYVIIDAVMHQNPFYVPPDQLLREIGRERGSSKIGNFASKDE
jgi:hypothetical protein